MIFSEQLCTQLISPKQANERLSRKLKLQLINKQLQSILTQNKNIQYAQYQNKFNEVQSIIIQNNDLKLKLQQLSCRYGQLQQLYKIAKVELQGSLCSFQVLQKRYKMQEIEIMRCKQLIKNQQNLFQEYRNNLQQQYILQKQYMKSSFNAQKIKLEKQISQTIIKIENQYNDKMKKIIKKNKIVEFKQQVHQFKKYCNDYKENIMKKSQSFYQKPNSQYSTNDRQTKHIYH